MEEKLNYGEVAKIRLTMPQVGLATLESVDWVLKVWAREEVEIRKADATFRDGNCYVFVDTTLTGKGVLYMQLYIDIPDADYKPGLRPQRPKLRTKYVVV